MFYANMSGRENVRFLGFFRNMKKIILSMLLSFGLYLTAFGQSMSETQILQFVQQEKKLGTSESDIAKKLLQKGATLEQIQNMRQKYAKQLQQRSMAGEADKAIEEASRMRKNNAPEMVDQNAAQQQMMQNVPDIMLYGDQPILQTGVSNYFGETPGKKVFGRDIFNNKSLTFEPVMNISTPQNYVLGPGDQLIIDVYGDTQKSVQLTVSPDGDVTVPDYGPIHVAGLSVSAAQARVHSSGQCDGRGQDSWHIYAECLCHGVPCPLYGRRCQRSGYAA